MTSIQIILDGDNCWPDLRELPDDQLVAANITGVALLPDAEVTDTFTGHTRRVPAVTVRLALSDGRVALAQVKLEMLETIVRGMRGRIEYLVEQRAAGKAEA